MKIVAALFTYEDPEYLHETIESIKRWPDKLYIIEGSWKSAQQYKNGGPRSGQQTYDIINKHVDDNRICLVQANEARERDQRQVGLELAKKDKADWFFMLDSDEVYNQTTLEVIKNMLSRASLQTLCVRMRSYNFINSFKKWYDGNYARCYRVTPCAKFIMDNDVVWPGVTNQPGILTVPQFLRFHHYNYVKLNSEQYHRKMFYQAEQDPSFNTRVLPQYGYDGKQYKIPDDCKIFPYLGRHPTIMKSHPYFINNVFADGPIDFDDAVDVRAYNGGW